MKTVLIDSRKDYVCTDEVYASFYKCPECKQEDVIQQSNYCNKCGSKIEWKHDEMDKWQTI